MKKLFFFLIGLYFLVGCSIHSPYVRPELSFLKEHYQNASDEKSCQQNGDSWWLRIDDLILHDLIAAGLEGNLDLQSARVRIQKACAELGIAEANLLPRIDLLGSSTANGQSREGIQGNNPALLRSHNMHRIKSTLSWELDLFGRIRQGQALFQAQLHAATLDFYATQVSLASQIAEEYFLYRTLEKRAAIACARKETQERLYYLNQSRFEAGIAPQIEATEARALLAETEAVLPNLLFQITESVYRLDILTGQSPGTWQEKIPSSIAMPPVPSLPEVGIPLDLLRRRPDVLAAEERLIAAHIQIGITRTEYLPKLQLTGTCGVEALKSENLLTSNARFFSIGPSLSWRLLEFWRIDREIQGAQSGVKEALIHYKRIVLNACAEVETALLRYQKCIETLRRERDHLQAETDHLNLLREQYRLGLLPFLNVAYAERRLQSTENQLVLAEQAALGSYILLNKSLGGQLW